MLRILIRKKIIKFRVLVRIRKIFTNFFPQYFYFRSYSQWGEDAVLSQFLHEKFGTYLDIGSGHPINGNNTYFLYQRGWRGILVDPIQRNYEATKKFRRKDIALHALVSEKTTKNKFWEFKNYSISTSEKDRAKKLIEDGHTLESSYFMESFSLARIFEQSASQFGESPILISIDVEEHELSVLKSNDWSKYFPRVICIEILNENLLDISEVHNFLFKRNYALRASVGNSQIFVLRSV
jgi:hypothetical protein